MVLSVLVDILENVKLDIYAQTKQTPFVSNGKRGSFYFTARDLKVKDKKERVRKDVPLNIKISSNVVYITPTRGTRVEDGDSTATNLTNTILSKIDKNGKLSIHQYNRKFEFDICGDTTHTLAIGINSYADRDLIYAEMDTLRFITKIKKRCNHVKTHQLLGKEALKNKILNSLRKISSRRNDVVVVYFTGDAFTLNGQKYIVPYGLRNNYKDKSLLLKDITSILKQKRGKEFLVIIDSQINEIQKDIK